jgi:hypothetical protein
MVERPTIPFVKETNPPVSGFVFGHSVIAVLSNPSSYFRRDGFHGISPD